MRILLTTDSYKPNIDGAAVFVERLAQKLHAKGLAVEIVAPSPTLRSYTGEEDGVRVHRRSAWKPSKNRGMLVAVDPAVREVALQLQPTVVHVNLPYAIGLDALRTASTLGLPVIATNHVVIEGISWTVPLSGATRPMIESLVRRYLLWFYRQCQTVVVPTRQAAKMLLGESDDNLPLKIVSNGVDLDLFKPRPATGESYAQLGLPQKPIVVYAGRLEVEKSMDMWLRAAAAIRKQVDAHFAIAGTGTAQGDLMALASELGIAEDVSFLGLLSSHQLSNLHNLATLFVICSATESQSIATLEAMASGLPVVAVNAEALPDLVHEGRNGFLVPSGDHEAIARRAVEILANAQLQRTFAVESRRIALTHTLDRTVDRYLALYRALEDGVSQRATSQPSVPWPPIRPFHHRHERSSRT
jgi:glycosyltransferase involved in cell wall biosynthesis